MKNRYLWQAISLIIIVFLCMTSYYLGNMDILMLVGPIAYMVANICNGHRALYRDCVSSYPSIRKFSPKFCAKLVPYMKKRGIIEIYISVLVDWIGFWLCLIICIGIFIRDNITTNWNDSYSLGTRFSIEVITEIYLMVAIVVCIVTSSLVLIKCFLERYRYCKKINQKNIMYILFNQKNFDDEKLLMQYVGQCTVLQIKKSVCKTYVSVKMDDTKEIVEQVLFCGQGSCFRGKRYELFEIVGTKFIE